MSLVACLSVVREETRGRSNKKNDGDETRGHWPISHSADRRPLGAHGTCFCVIPTHLILHFHDVRAYALFRASSMMSMGSRDGPSRVILAVATSLLLLSSGDVPAWRKKGQCESFCVPCHEGEHVRVLSSPLLCCCLLFSMGPRRSQEACSGCWLATLRLVDSFCLSLKVPRRYCWMLRACALCHPPPHCCNSQGTVYHSPQGVPPSNEDAWYSSTVSVAYGKSAECTLLAQ